VVVDEQEPLHPAWQRDLQSVEQSKVGGLLAHEDEHSDRQLEVQLASADAVHWLLHCCSSLVAHACTQRSGAHCVVQLFWTTSEHCALASMSTFPHAATAAACAACVSEVSETKGSEASA
jgi:hypothetical protein